MSGIILENLANLHTELYIRMSAITGITELQFLGFDDSKTRPNLPNVAMQISYAGFEVDRGRMMHDVQEYTNAPETVSYDGEESEIQTDYTLKKPLPIDIIYEIDTWCHDSQASLQMDLAMMATFPERGVLELTIDSETVDFPIELLDVQDLDDLTQNIREKLYRYKIEAWIPGFIDDRTGKIITTSITGVYQNNNDAENQDGPFLNQVVLQPD